MIIETQRHNERIGKDRERWGSEKERKGKDKEKWGLEAERKRDIQRKKKE